MACVPPPYPSMGSGSASILPKKICGVGTPQKVNALIYGYFNTVSFQFQELF